MLSSREDMCKHFETRTIAHIARVRNYIDKIIKSNAGKFLSERILEEEKRDHDHTKFKDPEREPYIHITWKYKKEGYCLPKDVDVTEATLHHLKHNRHHPEFWDDNPNISINQVDLDKASGVMVDSREMPLEYIAVMVADWMAVSEERNSSPYDWARNNVNKRWKFTKTQEKLVYDLLDEIWRTKSNEEV